MKSFKTIVLIGIIIFSIMFLWSCKKNETIEPEPVNNDPAITYEYDNLTTGDKTTFEINDMIYAKGTGKIADSRPYDGFVDFGIGLYEGNNNVFDITGLSTGKQREITVEGNSPLEKGILEEKEYDVKVDYTIMDANGDSTSHQLNIGTVMVTAEKDYKWGPEKNQIIYDNRDAIANLLGGTVSFHDILQDADSIRKALELWYDPTMDYVTWTDLFDTTPANSFQFVINAKAGVLLAGMSEEQAYKLRQIIGE